MKSHKNNQTGLEWHHITIPQYDATILMWIMITSFFYVILLTFYFVVGLWWNNVKRYHDAKSEEDCGVILWNCNVVSFFILLLHPSQSHNKSKMSKDVVMVIHKRIVVSNCGIKMWCHYYSLLFFFILLLHPSQSHNKSKMSKDVMMVIHKRIVVSYCGIKMWCHSYLIFFFSWDFIPWCYVFTFFFLKKLKSTQLVDCYNSYFHNVR